MVRDLPEPLKQDILLVMNLQQVTLLVLSDLSAAFDTVNYEVLLERLHTDVGKREKALDCFKSYLRRRIRAAKLRFSR